MARETSLDLDKKSRTGRVGNIVAFSGYFIAMVYLLLLYLLAYSLADGLFIFWSFMAAAGWPWLLAGLIFAISGITLIIIDKTRRILQAKAITHQPVDGSMHQVIQHPVEPQVAV
jgi:hypothetical protein